MAPAANSEHLKQLASARRWLESGDFAAAITTCQSLLEHSPDDMAALAMLAEAARLGGDFHVAIGALQRLAELAPRQPGVFQSLGRALLKAQRDAEAITALETCLRLAPKNADAQRSLGMAYARQGETERAIEAMRQALALNPRDSAAHYQLTTLIRADHNDSRIAELERLYDSNNLSDRDRSRLAFAIARILDQQGHFDAAFGWFRTANELRRKESVFDAETDAAWILRAIQTFDRQFFEKRADVGFRTRQPVFIVGLPRSGSSLLEQVLASHPEVFGAGELMVLPQTLEKLGDRLGNDVRLPEGVTEVPDAAWSDLGRQYAQALQAYAPDAKRIVDKQLFNYTLVGFIRLMLPDARILHTSRHPMATCWSCYATAFRNDRGFTWDLDDLGRTWRQYRRLMDHWQATIPDAILEVRYENLLEDLEGVMRQVLDFLGLGWSDRCLEFHKTRRTVATASKTQVRQPLYTSSRDHWRNYEKHLGSLHEAMRAQDD